MPKTPHIGNTYNKSHICGKKRDVHSVNVPKQNSECNIITLASYVDAQILKYVTFFEPLMNGC